MANPVVTLNTAIPLVGRILVEEAGNFVNHRPLADARPHLSDDRISVR